MLELKRIGYIVSEGNSNLGILKDISLTIDDHKLVVFTGPNGGGKTTLAKIIMGLVKPTSGQILWNGRDITELNITERARLGISYGFQQPPRFKGLTVRNLLTLASGDEKLSKDKCCQYLHQGGPVRQRLSGPGGGRVPLRRRGQAHRDRHHPGPEQPTDDL